MKYLIWFILIAVAWFFVRRFLNKFKVPKIGSIGLFTGGVKAGKSTIAVGTALSEYRSRHKAWKIKKFFCKIFNRPIPEEPLIYSNVPLKVDYVDLTEDLIFRRKRFRYGSVIYVNEASLLADSQLIRDMELNERLTLFNKLIGHETKGGCIIYDTQCISDNHYSVKRSLSNYVYVHHLTKWIPFFIIAHVREFTYSDDDSTIVNVQTEDTENTLRKVIIRKSTWKKFDTYSWSILTDDLPVEDKIIHGRELKDLKIHRIVSFKDFKTLPKDFVYKMGDKIPKGDNK